MSRATWHLTDSHQAASNAYTESLVEKLLQLIRRADPSDIDHWFNINRQELLTLVGKGHDGTSKLASSYLRAHARANGASLNVYRENFNQRQAWSSIQKTGPAVFKHHIAAGADTVMAQAAMMKNLRGSLYRLVYNGGRDTIQKTINRNNSVVKYRRVSVGTPCAFCALLISRGAVYKSKSAHFQAHDHDKCLSEPVYDSNEPDRPEAKIYDDLYKEVSEGYTGVGKLNAFRRALNN